MTAKFSVQTVNDNMFDELRKLSEDRKHIASKHPAEIMEIDGHKFDAAALADSILAFKIRRFKELADMTDPLYADFIREFEQLPGMPETLKLYEQMKAEEADA